MSLGCKLGWKVLICELILNKYMSWSCHTLILNEHMSSYFYLLDNNVDKFIRKVKTSICMKCKFYYLKQPFLSIQVERITRTCKVN